MKKTAVMLWFDNERLVVAGALWAAALQLAGKAGFRFRGHLADGHAARFARSLRRGLADVDLRPGDRRLKAFAADLENRARLEELAAFCSQGRRVHVAPADLHG